MVYKNAADLILTAVHQDLSLLPLPLPCSLSLSLLSSSLSSDQDSMVQRGGPMLGQETVLWMGCWGREQESRELNGLFFSAFFLTSLHPSITPSFAPSQFSPSSAVSWRCSPVVFVSSSGRGPAPQSSWLVSMTAGHWR